MNHRIGRIVFALAVGVVAASLSYRWATDSGMREERAREERAVAAARALVEDTLSAGRLEIVDPLAADRKVGKSYVYPEGDGWQVSGFYRRDSSDGWHPYLVTMDASHALVHLKVGDDDPGVLRQAAADDRLEVVTD